MKRPSLSVIISTYNSPKWLEKVLIGYNHQTFRDFEIVIADDGSGPETRQLIEHYQAKLNIPIFHVWHEDNGFQKTTILNRAILACNADYVLMTDGDCIPRNDFLKVHMDKREPGYFLSGGYIKLSMELSHEIGEKEIEDQRCFDIDWLRQKGFDGIKKKLKLLPDGKRARILNFITPTNASWNGHNSSGWKEDILRVNGFDERMKYGGEDRELGERLMNAGVRSKQIRYSAICVHLDHERGYVSSEAIEANKAIRKNTRNTKSDYTPFGIKQEV